MSILLEVKNLTIEFQSNRQKSTPVDNISFSLNKNETLGIAGESGSGKSLTSLAIMGLLSPSAKIINSNIFFYKENNPPIDLLSLDNKAMRQYRGKEIAMIFQEPMTSMNPVFTCGNQAIEAIREHQKISKKEAKDIIISLFEEVQLPRPDKIFDSYPHQLSGGQKQRVMIAMAVSCNPSLLIADEPTTALDVTIQKKIIETIQQMKEKYGMSVLFITHDLGLMASIADRALVMYKGKIIEENNITELFNHPQQPYTKGLLACRPPLDRQLKKLPTLSDFMQNNSDKHVKDFISSLTLSNDEISKNLETLYSQTPVLEIKNLKTYIPLSKNFFGKIKEYVKAVDEVSFSVYPGETLGLVGESGCGKTTLGRTILRLIQSTGGSIIYKGIDITHLAEADFRKMRKQIQIIFQDPYSSLNPRQTIGDAITEPMKIHGLYSNTKNRKDKAIELLVKVGLEENHFYRYPHEFSGGQRQRICIARALAPNPEFIICDESVSALDVSVQAQVLNLLNQLKKEFGFTYIFISHDLSVVKFMSDKIIVMKNGKFIEAGEAAQLYSHPQTEYTRNLIKSIPDMKK